jgi:hypothetical protein
MAGLVNAAKARFITKARKRENTKEDVIPKELATEESAFLALLSRETYG